MSQIEVWQTQIVLTGLSNEVDRIYEIRPLLGVPPPTPETTRYPSNATAIFCYKVAIILNCHFKQI